jgi:hypothetical protein
MSAGEHLAIASTMIRKDDRTLRALAMGQGLYFAATGIWPLVHMRSFERVTGAKTDKWLVQTVGILVGVIGGALVSAAIRRTITAETAGLAVGAAAGLGAVDTIFSARGQIQAVYLGDAAVEATLVAVWLRRIFALRRVDTPGSLNARD